MWLLVALAFLIAAAPAQAQERTVARNGEFTLHARESGDRLCMTLRRERRYQGEECGRIPRSPHRPLTLTPYVGFNNYAAAVAPAVRTAESVSSSGKRKRYRTFAARGFSARFVIVPAPPPAQFVRYYGADGVLLGMVGGPAGYIDIDENSTPVFGDEEPGVRAHTEVRIAPTPDQPDRIRTLACIDVRGSGGGTDFCDDAAANGLAVMGSCSGPDLVGALVAPDVTSVRVTLGSGAHVDLPAAALPPAFGGRRALGATLPAGEAVRQAVALDAAGNGVARVIVSNAPGGQPCGETDQGNDWFTGPLVPLAPPPGAVAVAGPLVVADQGETLCAALGALPPRTCPPPPVDSDRPRLLRAGVDVAGVLSADAARVTLQLDRGADVTVDTTAGPAYTGRWAGKLRFFAARVDDAREVTRAVVRDAGGTIIGVSTRGIPRRELRRTVLAEQAGQALQLLRREGDQPCLTAFSPDLPDAPRFCRDPNPGTPIDGPVYAYRGAVAVSCSPRQAVAYGPLPKGLAPPSILLAGDRTVRSRRIALRGDDAWVAFLPDAPVRGLASGKRSVPLNLPPASAQCGYMISRAF